MAPSAEAKRLRLAQAQGASAPSKGFVALSARAPRAAATSRMGLQAKRFLICAAFQDLAAHFLETPSAHFCRRLIFWKRRRLIFVGKPFLYPVKRHRGSRDNTVPGTVPGDEISKIP